LSPRISDFSLSKAAGDVLLEVLRDYFGSDQDFEDQVIPQGKPLHAEQGGFHQRFIQKINNYSVEGASLVVHIDSTGELVAVNGEFVEGKGLSMIATLTSKQALTIAINSWYKDRDTLPEVIGAAKLTVVRNSMDGSACFAWKAPVQFVEDVVVSLDKDFQEVVTKLDEHSGKRKLRQDYVFANAQNGEPCAIYPKVFGFDDGHSQEEEQENVGEIPSSRRLEVGDTPGTPFIETYDCHQTTDEATCILVSNAATNLTTGDLAIDSAHNYAIATYKYYWDNFQRDSIDDAGMVSIVFLRTVLLSLSLFCCFGVLLILLLSCFLFVSPSVIEILCSLGCQLQ
jgi:bacillolysin